MKLKDRLVAEGQQHIIPLLEQKEANSQLAMQLEALDWDVVHLWQHPEQIAGKGVVQPIEGLTLDDIRSQAERFRQIGVSSIKRGQIGAVLLAGGQGTRLGSELPKGAYDIGVTKPVYIFELLVTNLLKVCKQCKAYVPLFVMTSPQNDEYTKCFFARHNYFGYPSSYIRFFTQEMAPCVDFNGKLLLQGRDRLAMSPNGNGGWYSALVKADVLRDFPDLEWLNVFGVDNVLQQIADPVFVGATVASGFNCGAKVVRKVDPHERVGVLCMENGHPSVVEYYELTDEMANATNADGKPSYCFGVTLNYLFRLQKLKETADKRMPVHVVKKKISFTDEKGNLVTPKEENGYKFETLLLDMVRMMESCLPFEVEREHEFAPVKDKTGVDSVESARKLLQLNGVKL